MTMSCKTGPVHSMADCGAYDKGPHVIVIDSVKRAGQGSSYVSSTDHAKEFRNESSALALGPRSKIMTTYLKQGHLEPTTTLMTNKIHDKLVRLQSLSYIVSTGEYGRTMSTSIMPLGPHKPTHAQQTGKIRELAAATGGSRLRPV